ncbi:hypothetical protein Acr_06g0009890 [Actinidia rufa]|uniref:Uncharacterized protein n=1 Tax=Actinidia rufa TaxID=165716 RepID=A0A7J0ESS1_9ERIC|nr:hypothetical protein Acr_06g0009890 [Actinidia rufa]
MSDNAKKLNWEDILCSDRKGQMELKLVILKEKLSTIAHKLNDARQRILDATPAGTGRAAAISHVADKK